MSDVSILVADVSRMTSIRDGVRLPGRMMHFTSGSLGSAMESIRAYRPRLVAIDAAFAGTPPGAAFVERVDALDVPGCAVRLIGQQDGRWVTVPRGGSPPVAPPKPATVVPPKPAIVVAPAPSLAVNTRRAPRFAVRNPIDAVVESGCARLVDLSVLGAQIVSQPALRPSQKIKIGLPDTGDLLNVIATVAWSTFELTTPAPRYRVGVEFTGAARQALEQYRLRHCAEQPSKIGTT